MAAELGARIYLDTNIFIYLVEGHPTYAQPLLELFGELEHSTIEAVTSELSIAEVLVKPIQDKKPELAEVYKNLLAPESQIRALPIDRATLLKSAEIRAQFGGRAFDCIHVATATLARCSSFITNDEGIRAPRSLRIVHLEELLS
jgi:predicted nucleic acid-binding protein